MKSDHQPDHRPTHGARSGWRWAIALAIALLVLRIAVLVLSGLGLSADEAHYWDWSRHLDWSYPTKGPAIAYAIAGATALFGDHPWAIRTVAAASGSALVLLAFGLTRCAGAHLESPERVRAAKWGAVLVAFFPAFQVTGLIATIDGPYVACWVGAAWAGLAMCRRLEDGRIAMGQALALGVLLGAGFLFKYTILLLAPGLLIALFMRRKQAHCWKRTLGTLFVVLSALMLCAMPVLIWNQREGWPTVAHLLGHLGAPGGDVPTDPGTPRSWTILWFLEFVGAQLGIAGPFFILMYLGVRTKADGLTRAVLTWSAVPIIVVYLGVSLVTDTEANWPIAGYTTLLCLAALHIPAAMDRYRDAVCAWIATPEPRAKAGLLRKKPETLWQLGTHLSLGYAGALALFLLALPLVTRVVTIKRLELSHTLGDAVLDRLEAQNVEPSSVIIIAARYTIASRLAHELHLRLGDDAPLVTSAASLVGDRRSAYDYWPETDPRAIRPGPVLFVGGARPAKWTRRFDTGTMIPMLDEPNPEFGGLYYAPDYAGLLETAR